MSLCYYDSIHTMLCLNSIYFRITFYNAFCISVYVFAHTSHWKQCFQNRLHVMARIKNKSSNAQVIIDLFLLLFYMNVPFYVCLIFSLTLNGFNRVVNTFFCIFFLYFANNKNQLFHVMSSKMMFTLSLWIDW